MGVWSEGRGVVRGMTGCGQTDGVWSVRWGVVRGMGVWSERWGVVREMGCGQRDGVQSEGQQDVVRGTTGCGQRDEVWSERWGSQRDGVVRGMGVWSEGYGCGQRDGMWSQETPQVVFPPLPSHPRP